MEVSFQEATVSIVLKVTLTELCELIQLLEPKESERASYTRTNLYAHLQNLLNEFWR